MSDSKEYYYMRLKDNYFDGDKQRILESKKNSYEYSTILLKLYLKSLKNDGCLKYSDKIPYDAKTLSTVTGHKEQRIKEALAVFQELDLIEVLDSGEIFMLDIQNFIGKTSTEGDRKRAYRKRISDCKSGHLSDIHPPEIEKESKPKIKIDAEMTETKESNKIYFSDFSGDGGDSGLDAPELQENPFGFSDASVERPDFGTIEAYASSNLRTFTPGNMQELVSFKDDFPDEVIRLAIDQACGCNAPSWNYVRKVLNNWIDKGIKTAADAKADIALGKQQAKPNENKRVYRWVEE